MQESQTQNLSEFFKLARDACCNYSDTGPFKMKHYCWMEPKKSGYQCLLFKGIACKWFAERVLPLDKDLFAAWERALLSGSDRAPLEIFRTCQCGKRFKPKSNRQRLCPECSKENRLKLNRNNKRKQRVKKGSDVTL